MSGPQALLEDLGRNIALVLALMFAFGWVRELALERRPHLRGVLSGILFGLASIASLASSVRLAPGVIVDMRNVLVALAFVFEGPVAGIIAGAVAIAYRIGVGGQGVVPGVLLIVAAVAIGAWFYHQRGQAHAPSSKALLAMGACISLAALGLTFLLALELPVSEVLQLLERVLLAVGFGYPAGTLLVGTLLSYETRRRDDERALRHERDLLQRVSATSPASIVVLDRQGRVVMSNAQAEKLLGVDQNTMMRRAYNDPGWRVTGFDGEPVPDEQLPFRRVTEARAPVSAMRHAVQAGDRTVRLSINGAPMFDEHGEVVGAVMALEDVTERVDAERRLHESEEKFRTLFNRTSEAIFVQPLVEKGVARFVEVNDLACSWLGQTRQELENLTFADVDVAHDPSRVEELFRAARDRPVTFEAELKGVHGSSHAVEVVAHSVMLQGKPVIMALARDLSERRALEAQVRQSQKLEVVGRLAGGIAHDFNNVLGIILLCSEAIEREPQSSTTPQLALQIRHSAERGSALTKQLLTFSRKQVVVPRTLAFSKALDTMLKLFRRLIPSDVVMKSRFADEGACVRMDLAQLEQVVLNLVVNARDAVAGKGRIDIATSRLRLDHDALPDADLPAGDYILLEVRDTGAGMSHEVRERVFEPFFTTKEEHGTGLGLSICFGIIKQAGGEIKVESEPGRGTTFRVYLPVVPGDEPCETAKLPARASGFERVMLVEDEPSLRLLVRSFLVEVGYDVVDFAGAEPALLYAQQAGSVDVLLTDIVMPGMSGPELAQELLQQWPELPVVYMTGYAAEMLARYGLDADKVSLVRKPFSVHELAATIRSALNMRMPVCERSY